ncbi:MAG TPA: type VI secretion system amidase effector protein Tae4 [Ideonella sp.]|uniref:type VI secretion system amidase effector protein Tae4 n=1 Tax=Ideonella sp. TaxID=1929293 RepID=UPI002E350CD0|nr:type VI secretion system amidase effector protein Tae4 [Ideonella sp.]HEX5683715.1 type VI secretion system amidase effector protein Tae4 [Ideonella sp.]
MTTRPSFSAAWAASMQIYDPVNSAARVASVVGGKVAANILPPGQAGKWGNTCAVRLSYVLNKTGVLIPHTPGKTVSGADHRWYFHYVRDVIQFLQQRWGKPDLVASFPPTGGGELSGKKGLVLFEVEGWADATGHATLWNGTVCYDHCYFNEPGVRYRTPKANFWRLP